jgi:hypothetical protein
MMAANETASKQSGGPVWCVRGAEDSTHIRGWRSFLADEADNEPESVLEVVRLSKRGHFVEPRRFPSDLKPMRYGNAHRQRALQIFSSGYAFVSQPSADILRQFDLGNGNLVPVRLWHPDRKTQVPGEFFYLNQGNRKDAFLPDKSQAYKPYKARDVWRLLPNPVDDQLVFSSSALEGPDIWWDERFLYYFFISNRLAMALKAAKVARDWGLLRCPITGA